MIPSNDDHPDLGSQASSPSLSSFLSGDVFTPSEGYLDDDAEEAFDDDLGSVLPGLRQEASPAWQHALRRDFEQWLETVAAMADPTDEEVDAAEDAPSLHSFHEQLTIATTEWKRSGRRTADALAQLGESLASLGEETRQLRAQRTQADYGNSLDEGWSLNLVELADRVQRLQQAFDRPPAVARTWWPGARAALEAWQSVWQTQSEAFAILAAHVDGLLRKASLERISTQGQRLDPSCMSAVAVETHPEMPDQTVILEILPGYRRAGKVLRAAQVKVSRQP